MEDGFPGPLCVMETRVYSLNLSEQHGASPTTDSTLCLLCSETEPELFPDSRRQAQQLSLQEPSSHLAPGEKSKPVPVFFYHR